MSAVKLGFIGAGNMASALARGWNEPALVADVDAAKAETLAREIGGEVAADNAQLASGADVVVLCHKPAQLAEVAESTGGAAKAVISILAAVSVAELEEAYPGVPIYRFMPNLAAEVQTGLFCYVAGSRAADGPEEAVLELFGRLGTVVPLEEDLMLAATAIMSCAPAWMALVAEALIDAGESYGFDQADAERLVAGALAGTAALISEGGLSTADVQRRVASPGGLTQKGLDVLEERGVRAAVADAVDVVMGAR
jgi:pyrroline-5-carboxylate reductase